MTVRQQHAHGVGISILSNGRGAFRFAPDVLRATGWIKGTWLRFSVTAWPRPFFVEGRKDDVRLGNSGSDTTGLSIASRWYSGVIHKALAGDKRKHVPWRFKDGELSMDLG